MRVKTAYILALILILSAAGTLAHAAQPSDAKSTSEKATGGPIERQYWKKGLDAFERGDRVSNAIKDLYRIMPPDDASLTLVATIVGTLWGDHYFDYEEMRMNVQRLADDLNRNTKKDVADCKKAAERAFKDWHGLAVRADFQDKARIPRPDGPWPIPLKSPDVIVTTTEKEPWELIDAWNKYEWGPKSGDKNYLYGRAASVNIEVPIKEGRMKMFVVPGSINPPNPQSWEQVATEDNRDEVPLQKRAGETALQPGDRAASTPGFIWTVPGAGHYCVISVAGSEFFENDPMRVPPGNWKSMMWITYNGAAGWHNIDTPRGDRAVLKIHNLDGTPERFEIEAHASELPEGTTVSLEMADKELASSSNVMRIVARDQVVRIDAELPGHYTGDVIIELKTPDGKPLPPEAEIDVRGYWHIPPGHRRYEDAVELLGDTKAIALSRPVRLFVGSFTLVGKL